MLPGDEILIVNDGSTDSTGEFLVEWQKNYSQLQVITLKKNGLVNALNVGLDNSSNTWVARFDIDDTYHVDRVLKQRHLIRENVGAIFCDYSITKFSGESLGTIPSAVLSPLVYVSLISGQRTPHPGVMLNRDFAKEVGNYRKDEFLAEDLGLWLRLGKISEIVSVPETLFSYRLSDNSVSSQNRTAMVAMKDFVLNRIGFDAKKLELAVQHLDSYVQAYKDYQLSDERILLLYRDLFLLSKRSWLKLGTGYYANVIKNVDSTKVIFKLMESRNLRKKYRKFAKD